MSSYQNAISLRSRGFCDIIDITDDIEDILGKGKIQQGIVTVFVPGSTGAVTTIEYESGVLNDLKRAFERLMPSTIQYDHDATWGDGNGFSHVRAALIGPSLTLPVHNRQTVRGTWQQVVFIDFDNRPRSRNIVVTVVGE